MKKQSIIIILVFAILILLGIFAYFKMFKIPVDNTLNTNEIVNNITEQEEIDTTDWVEYRNEDLGFEFRYPEEWDAPDGWKDVLIIKITKSENLNNNILKLKGSIEKNKTQNIIQLNKQIHAQLDVYYTTINGIKYNIVGDILYGVKFFIDNDLVEVAIILPREANFDLPKEKEKLDLFIQQIRDGNVEDKTNKMIIRFNEVLSTFVFL